MIAAAALPVAGLALVLAGLAGTGAVALAVLVALLLLAVALPSVFELPDERAATVVIALCGGAALVLGLAEDRGSGGDPTGVGYAVAGLGVVMVLAIGAQLLRRDGRPGLVPSLALTVTAAALAVVGTVWVPLSRTPAGSSGVAAAGLGLACAGIAIALVDGLGRGGARERRLRAPLVLLAGGIGGALGALVVGPLRPGTAIGVGLIAAAIALVADLLVTQAARERRAAAGLDLVVDVQLGGVLAATVAVLLTAGPVYVLLRPLTG